jgi:hypothetical protein
VFVVNRELRSRKITPPVVKVRFGHSLGLLLISGLDEAN